MNPPTPENTSLPPNPTPVRELPPVEKIQLLLMDVDGVLTDGGIFIDDLGRETKRFHVRDGLAIKAWQRLGLQVGILTGRSSRVVAHRANELAIDLLEQRSSNKAIGFENLLRKAGVTPEQVAYIGDDLADLPVMCTVGYPIAVADAALEVRQVSRFVTTRPGGHAAVREAIEHLLRSMGRWTEVLEHFGL